MNEADGLISARLHRCCLAVDVRKHAHARSVIHALSQMLVGCEASNSHWMKSHRSDALKLYWIHERQCLIFAGWFVLFHDSIYLLR